MTEKLKQKSPVLLKFENERHRSPSLTLNSAWTDEDYSLYQIRRLNENRFETTENTP